MVRTERSGYVQITENLEAETLRLDEEAGEKFPDEDVDASA